MFGKAKLDLERIDPLPGDFYQVIGAAAEKEKTVAIAHKAVSGVDPPLLADGLGRLVGPVPVQRRCGITAHPQNAFFVVGDVAAILVPERDFVTGDTKSGGAEFFP